MGPKSISAEIIALSNPGANTRGFMPVGTARPVIGQDGGQPENHCRANRVLYSSSFDPDLDRAKRPGTLGTLP